MGVTDNLNGNVLKYHNIKINELKMARFLMYLKPLSYLEYVYLYVNILTIFFLLLKTGRQYSFSGLHSLS